MNRFLNLQPGLLATLFALAFLAFGLTGCDDDDDPDPNDSTRGVVTLTFNHQVDGRSLDQCCGGLSNGDEVYTINNGQDSITIDKIRYWVTNVRFVGTNGTPDYAEPNSYHLIQLHPGDTSNPDREAVITSFCVENVPNGEYSSVRFYIGVDSAANTEVPNGQYGDLEAGIGMDWTWNAGYIFYKQEGRYYDPDSGWLGYFLHIGRDTNLVELNAPLPQALNTDRDFGHEIRLNADLARIFTGGEDILGALNQKQGDPRKIMADPNNDYKAAANYSDFVTADMILDNPACQQNGN